MNIKTDIVIIGAGTAGLSARREVAKVTQNYLVIDSGPLGTTCARVGCMPSKVLIQVANDLYQAKKVGSVGINNTEQLTVDSSKVMTHVRHLRDRFVRSVVGDMKSWQDEKFIAGRAEFLSAHQLRVGDVIVEFEAAVIATGSAPMLPAAWQSVRSHLVTTDEFFEMPNLPKKMAVIGLGVIGLELGQGMSRLGVEVVGISKGSALSGISDPALQEYVFGKISKEFLIDTSGVQSLDLSADKSQLVVKTGNETYTVDRALISIGRKIRLDGLGLEKLGVSLGANGVPLFDSNTLALSEAPHIFIAGDVNGERQILHEAADEGVIAGHNCVRLKSGTECFKRRTSLGITFSDPNIASVGANYASLIANGIAFKTGQVSFEGQGRSIVKLKEVGLLRVYAAEKTGQLLGAELFAPDGEHLAHLLAWVISLNMTAAEVLRLPFYHPVIEEGLRTALRDVATQVAGSRPQEVVRCQDSPVR